MLIIDGAKYKLWTPKDEEKEFHPMVREHHKEIFGEDSIYFDIKQVIRTSSGIGSIPDAYVIKLNPPQWFVIENELATHPIYEHIVNQLTRFINGIENQGARIPIIDTIYSRINEDLVLKAVIRKAIGTDDIYHFIYKLISSTPKIVILIDEKVSETEEACHIFKYPTEIIEFKTYVRENAESIHAHFFEPLCESPGNGSQEEGEKPPRKPTPEYMRTWAAKINWVNPKIKELTQAMQSEIAKLGGVEHVPSGPDYKFYKGRRSSDSIFAGMFLTHDALKVRIRTDSKLSDSKKWVSERTYKWFFRSGEREFTVKDINQLAYAMELIKQSYSLAK